MDDHCQRNCQLLGNGKTTRHHWLELAQISLPCTVKNTVGDKLSSRSDNHIMKTRSHLVNRRRWRGQRFGPATRREEGASLKGAVTDEQRSGRPKDRPFPVIHLMSFAFHFWSFCFSNAAAGIYEMASSVNLFGRAGVFHKELGLEKPLSHIQYFAVIRIT
jgi:hypothetical protein